MSLLIALRFLFAIYWWFWSFTLTPAH